MNTAFRAILLLVALASTATAQKLTYEEAKARIPEQELPEFWISVSPR